MTDTHLWIRAETRATEQRTPIVPDDARQLIAQGFHVTVEESPHRVFPIQEYRAVGCEIAPTGSWPTAPDDAYIIGIKELPSEPAALRHNHIYFAHAYKGQEGAGDLLSRFAAGGGQLLDIEYLTVDGRRVVAFGYWAGYVGASLGVLAHSQRLTAPLHPMARTELDRSIADAPTMRALVIGALGRSGQGAMAALRAAGIEPTQWDRDETQTLDRAALLDHDVLVNCVVADTPATREEQFVREEDVAHNRRLSVISDVTCDVTGPANRLPINTAVTTWGAPIRRIAGTLDVIAIDNLPSLLPREASIDFSHGLTPHLAGLADRSGPWAAALDAFQKAQA